MDIKKMESIIEAMLFSSGDPVPLERISDILELDKKTAKSIMSNMILRFDESGRGTSIREIDGGYQMMSKPEYFEYIRKLLAVPHRQKLSQAAYETLSIVAYNQPVTRAKIEKLRGVNSDSALTRLIERNLVEEAGRMDAPGRPVLYRTTQEFLRSFGFRSINDLPAITLGKQDTETESIIENMNS